MAIMGLGFDICRKDLIQEAITEGRLKFEESKTEMKVDSDPFEVNSNFVEPCCFEAHMVGFHSFEFDTSLGNFKQNIHQVFPGVGEGLLDFLMQQKLKD
ncbi:hypothetical protein PIB30_085418 [Stylosanthes scabra]|uniref:Uncharacterized protein n=1 Tax=Stylosanthes scabra TaxID=79078 RepID=A0ABU6YRR4_9FABA|nr:hypothetical protein [Stylosanthes scabra]